MTRYETLLQALVCAAFLGWTTTVAAQHSEDALDARHCLSVNLGLIQPLLLHGANAEVDFRWGYLVVNYSHGWSLQLRGGTVTGEQAEQHLQGFIPYSTGFGVGPQYYFESLHLMLDARLEAKWHSYEFSVENPDGTLAPLRTYRTATLGGGIYATWFPFASGRHATRGLNVSVSFRYWPKVWTSLRGDEFQYANDATGRMETHRASNIGIANTPFIFNVSVGYAFEL